MYNGLNKSLLLWSMSVSFVSLVLSGHIHVCFWSIVYSFPNEEGNFMDLDWDQVGFWKVNFISLLLNMMSSWWTKQFHSQAVHQLTSYVGNPHYHKQMQLLPWRHWKLVHSKLAHTLAQGMQLTHHNSSLKSQVDWKSADAKGCWTDTVITTEFILPWCNKKRNGNWFFSPTIHVKRES